MGWKNGEAGKRLGLSASTIMQFRTDGVPKGKLISVSLACKALEAGIKP